MNERNEEMRVFTEPKVKTTQKEKGEEMIRLIGTGIL
jgi:hypothetical protein